MVLLGFSSYRRYNRCWFYVKKFFSDFRVTEIGFDFVCGGGGCQKSVSEVFGAERKISVGCCGNW